MPPITLLVYLYRENNAKAAADSDWERLKMQLQTSESLAKKKDDEINSYKKEVRLATVVFM